MNQQQRISGWPEATINFRPTTHIVCNTEDEVMTMKLLGYQVENAMNQPNLFKPPETIPVEQWADVAHAIERGCRGISPLASAAITFTVFGVAAPAGSKTASALYGRDGKPVMKNGRVVTTTRDANPKSKEWKQVVAYTARQSYQGPLLEGPIRFTMTAYRLRPGGHFSKSTGAMNKKGRDNSYPLSAPDVLKLARGIEDALTGVIWRDDAQIVDEHLYKRWGDVARIEVKIERMV